MEDGERIALRNSSHCCKKSIQTISILVVDDDTTCLSIVAAILKKFRYEVVTVKHPKDALCTLRMKERAFDLVVSDVHMPEMNGFELQQAIAQEFNLPVVLMSADDKEGVALRGLERGAAFFILKPVCPDDLRDLWQFAAMKKSRSDVVEERRFEIKSFSDEFIGVSAVNEGKSVNKKDGTKGDHTVSGSTKKPKVIWSNSLHNRFLEAIRSIGLDRAVPKKILEVMNVPGLTRENVASHLQKYRIFLRRVSDASYKIQYSTDNKGLRKLRSSCESSSSTVTRPLSSLITLNRLNQNIPADPFQMETCMSQSSLMWPSRLFSDRGGSCVKPSINASSTNQMSHQIGCSSQNDDHTPTLPIGVKDHLAVSNTLSSSVHVFPVPTNYYEGATHSMSSDEFSNSTKYVGCNISNLKNLTKPTQSHEGLNTFSGNHTNICLDQQFSQLMEASMGNVSGGGGGQFSDYTTLLMSSNSPLVPATTHVVESGGKGHNDSSFAPILDLSELDILSTIHQMQLEGEEGGGFGAALAHDRPNVLNQRDDDDFLESLLAPFLEDQTPQGI